MENYYTILGCSRDANHQQLKESYHRLVLEHHPDKANSSSHEFQKINQAWKILRDVDRRRAYDQTLRQSEMEEQTYLFGSFSISQLSFDNSTQMYSYKCRCGGEYKFTKTDSEEFNSCLVGCDQCSLMISVELQV